VTEKGVREPNCCKRGEETSSDGGTVISRLMKKKEGREQKDSLISNQIKQSKGKEGEGGGRFSEKKKRWKNGKEHRTWGVLPKGSTS